MLLSQLRKGSKALIRSIAKGNSAYRKRLIALGLLPGTAFTVTRFAPLGDPIEIQVRGFTITLRKGEAAILDVEKIPT